MDKENLEARLAAVKLGSKLVSPATFLRARGPIRYAEPGAPSTPSVESSPDCPEAPATTACDTPATTACDTPATAGSDESAVWCRAAAEAFASNSSPPIKILHARSTTPRLDYIRSYAETPLSNDDESEWTPSVQGTPTPDDDDAPSPQQKAGAQDAW